MPYLNKILFQVFFRAAQNIRTNRSTVECWYKAMQEPEAWQHHQSKLFQAITGYTKTCEHTVNVTSQSSCNVIQ